MGKLTGVVLAVCSLFGAVAESREVAPPNTFPTLAACTEALQSGYYRFYEPRFFGLAPRNPVNNRDRIVIPLESDTCLQMLVVGGVQFVVQREGTLFRAQKLADGSLSLYARDDCGNPVYGMVLSPAPEPNVAEPPRIRQQMQHPPPPVRQLRERDVAVVAVDDDDDGFCSSKKCRWTLAAIGGAAIGYTAYRLWPCPTGTRRR